MLMKKMNKFMVIASLLIIAACGKVEEDDDENWIEIHPQVIRMDSVRYLWIIHNDNFVDIAIRQGDSVMAYDERDSYFLLDSSEIKTILRVLEGKSSVDVDHLRMKLYERLELDRAYGEMECICEKKQKNIKNN
jgi:hypothetical protein